MSEFVASARRAVTRLYPGIATSNQYASVATDKHYERLARLRDDAVSAGANAQSLADTAGDKARRFLPPTLITEVTDDMTVMKEEIFGPLLPVLPYDSIDQVIAYIGAHAHPLALYMFDDNNATIDRVLSRTQAGGVTVNDTPYHIAQHGLPFC